jgi:hypothetical protein
MAPNTCLGEITVLKKNGGPLSKHLELRDGKIVNDGSACFMTNGTAHRVIIESVQGHADLINSFAPNQAYALGRLKEGVPDGAEVVVADKLNGGADPSVIARTKEYLIFKEGEPGLALLDVDLKGIPDTVKRRLEECGGALGALCEVLPVLKTVARVERASTSSGLRNSKTGEEFPGSGGMHIALPVRDAADIPRFLSDFHDRLWLAGLGWGMASRAGSFLERSLIDKSVGSPERLIFEGPPTVVPPLVQEGRNAIAYAGLVLDTRSACLPLTDAEKADLQKLKDAEKRRLLPEREAKRAAWSVEHIERLTARGMSETEARAQVDRWIDWQELSGDFPLPFDDASIFGITVAEVLAAPDSYINKSLADPFEGRDYGRNVAILYGRPNGSLFIKSFAHGGINYELKADRAAGLVWPEPDMAVLRLQRREAPRLPIEIFGERWSRWIRNTAEASACPVDYVAAPLLAAASAVIGHARWPLAGETWAEPPHLWCASVGDSGDGKSPGADAIYRHIMPEMERRMTVDFPDQLREAQAAIAVAEAKHENWKSAVRDAIKADNTPPSPPPLSRKSRSRRASCCPMSRSSGSPSCSPAPPRRG